MQTQSITALAARLVQMESNSLKRIEALHAEVRDLRVRLEAEIEACNLTLAQCEES